MGWAVGFDPNWQRDIGYGVPSLCDHPGCRKRIDRGLAYVCGNDVYGGEDGCGLFFCDDHRTLGGKCERCTIGRDPFEPKPDVTRWLRLKLTDGSWAMWRAENPDAVAAIRERLGVA